MKRLVILLAFTACQLFAMAQKELHIGPLFEGKIVPHDQMVETRVRGRSLSKYGLTYFHSLRFEPSTKEEKAIKKLLKEDMKTTDATQTMTKVSIRYLCNYLLSTARIACFVISNDTIACSSSIWKALRLHSIL